jgi:hypothetical protein
MIGGTGTVIIETVVRRRDGTIERRVEEKEVRNGDLCERGNSSDG